MLSNSSPYLNDSRRLADVLAAIQVLGSNTFASLKAPVWAEKLGDPASQSDWTSVFLDHPEFFRVSGDWISLRMRHAGERTYSAALGEDLSKLQIEALSEEDRGNLTRKPLSSSQIEALMKTAIELHARGIAHQQEHRWLTPLLFALLGTVVGVVLQAALK